MTALSRTPPTDIVVVTWNALPSLKRCLQSIRRHTKQFDHTLTVVDNGSTDGTSRWLKAQAKKIPMRVLYHSRNLGISKASNLGIRCGKNRWIVRLDDDAQVTKGWLGELHAQMRRRPRAAIAGCKIVYPDSRIYGAEHLLPDLSNGIFEQDRGQRDYVRTVESVSGTCLLMCREAWRQLRGFHPGHFDVRLSDEMEDADLCLRFRVAGWQVLYVGSVTVIHRNLQRRRSKRSPHNRSDFSRRHGRFDLFPLPDSHPIDRQYLAAMRAHSLGNLSLAAATLRRLRESDPRQRCSSVMEGFILLEQKQASQARAIFQKEIRRSDDPTAWMGLARTELCFRRRRQAERYFRQAMKISSRARVRVLHGWVQGLLEQSETALAASFLHKMVRKTPEHPASWWMLAKVSALEGKSDQAEQSAQKFLQLVSQRIRR